MILGIDFGMRYIGFALGYSKDLIIPLQAVDTKRDKNHIAIVMDLVRSYPIELIVVGYPHMGNGHKNELKKYIDAFVSIIKEKTKKPVKTWDETLSSFEALNMFKDLPIKPSLKKRVQNKKYHTHALSALIILRSFLSDEKNCIQAKNYIIPSRT